MLAMQDALTSAPLLMEIETEWAVLPPPPSSGDPGWALSWQHLFERYVPAMQAYVAALLRRVPAVPPDTSGDVVSAYLAASMEKGWLSRHAEEIRSFRAYLKTQLFRFTSDWLDRHFAERRSPKREAGPVREDLHAAPDDAADALDRGFLDVAVQRALAELTEVNEEQAEVVRDLLRTEGGSTDLAERLGRPEKQMAVLRHRARRKFAMFLATELKRTVADEAAFSKLIGSLESHLP